jgi:hypothetical protein
MGRRAAVRAGGKGREPSQPEEELRVFFVAAALLLEKAGYGVHLLLPPPFLLLVLSVVVVVVVVFFVVCVFLACALRFLFHLGLVGSRWRCVKVRLWPWRQQVRVLYFSPFFFIASFKMVAGMPSERAH